MRRKRGGAREEPLRRIRKLLPQVGLCGVDCLGELVTHAAKHPFLDGYEELLFPIGEVVVQRGFSNTHRPGNVGQSDRRIPFLPKEVLRSIENPVAADVLIRSHRMNVPWRYPRVHEHVLTARSSKGLIPA
jgi:hypothetical protein